MSSKRKVVAFDLYGTLLSTSSIAGKLSEYFGKDKAQSVAAEWRKQQLEYTWRLNSMGNYQDFSIVTKNSLSHALASHSLSLTQDERSELMDSYGSLSTFDDVVPALEHVSKEKSLQPVLFTNGTSDMVHKSLSSPSLAPHAKLFDSIVTVDECDPKVYKPHPEVYHHLAKKTGMQDKLDNVWVITANPFDVVGAISVGMQAAWVDREKQGWQDRCMGIDLKPTITGTDLKDLIQMIAKA